MFTIRRIFDDALAANRNAIEQAERLFRASFPAAPASDIEGLRDKLHNPFKHKFRAVLYVAEKAHGNVRGFAILLHDPTLHFSYLDYLASDIELSGRGYGAALYERVREEALRARSHGLFYECLPDTPELCSDPAMLKANIARLRFYERYGARPIVGTAYETPVSGGPAENTPHLVFDDLGLGTELSRTWTRKVIRAILERKYASLCPPEYVDMVVRSVRSDPVELRPPRYVPTPKRRQLRPAHVSEPIGLTVNDRHEIHHVRERGYVESPVRVKVIRDALEESGLFTPLRVKEFPLARVTEVHDEEFVRYLQRACKAASPKRSVYPYVFPVRNATRPPRELSVMAGYYCIDTFTPIHPNAFLAAKAAVDCTLTCAEEILKGRRLAYALVRPPGHHAERRTFGGFCYLNSGAIAAQYLSKHGKVAILDVDYHHGNGQQEIFYDRADVFTVSIHGDPAFAYPYFTGFADERGEGPGEGFNLNLPLPENQDGAQYRRALARALEAVRQFEPTFLIVGLGLDPAKGDPTGTWSLSAQDFHENGRAIGRLRLPTLVVQEGGYRTRTLGINARHFFEGLAETAYT